MLATIGHGRVSLLDKIQAHAPQAGLVYGPPLQTLARANASARQRSLDMGAEFGVADAPEVKH